MGGRFWNRIEFHEFHDPPALLYYLHISCSVDLGVDDHNNLFSTFPSSNVTEPEAEAGYLKQMHWSRNQWPIPIDADQLLHESTTLPNSVSMSPSRALS
jgi:hypothetical protein